MEKNPRAIARDTREVGSIPGSGRSPEGGNGTPFQCSCLENSMGEILGKQLTLTQLSLWLPPLLSKGRQN